MRYFRYEVPALGIGGIDIRYANSEEILQQMERYSQLNNEQKILSWISIHWAWEITKDEYDRYNTKSAGSS